MSTGLVARRKRSEVMAPAPVLISHGQVVELPVTGPRATSIAIDAETFLAAAARCPAPYVAVVWTEIETFTEHGAVLKKSLLAECRRDLPRRDLRLTVGHESVRFEWATGWLRLDSRFEIEKLPAPGMSDSIFVFKWVTLQKPSRRSLKEKIQQFARLPVPLVGGGPWPKSSSSEHVTCPSCGERDVKSGEVCKACALEKLDAG